MENWGKDDIIMDIRERILQIHQAELRSRRAMAISLIIVFTVITIFACGVSLSYGLFFDLMKNPALDRYQLKQTIVLHEPIIITDDISISVENFRIFSANNPAEIENCAQYGKRFPRSTTYLIGGELTILFLQSTKSAVHLPIDITIDHYRHRWHYHRIHTYEIEPNTRKYLGYFYVQRSFMGWQTGAYTISIHINGIEVASDEFIVN